MRDVHPGDGFAVTLDTADGTPSALLARAEVHFLEGPLVGLALRGFSVWRSTASLLVTVPRVNSSVTFLRPSRLSQPALSERTLRTLFDAILSAYSKH